MTKRGRHDGLTGGCACGAVRYVATGPYDLAILCYCRACQYASGGGPAAQFRMPDGQIVLSGKTTSFRRYSDGGFEVTKDFCPTCGTPLWTTTARFPGARFIFAGTLDDPDAFEPMTEAYAEARPAWSISSE